MEKVDHKKLRALEIQRGRDIQERVKAGFSEEDKVSLLEESTRILDLDLKTLARLEEVGISTMGDFRTWSIHDFLIMPNLNYEIFQRLEEDLSNFGIDLKGYNSLKREREKKQRFEKSMYAARSGDLLVSTQYEQKENMEKDDFEKLWKLSIERGKEILQLINEEPIHMDTSFILEESVTILDLSTRARNCLLNSEILTIGELLDTSIYELLRLRNVGKLSIEDINNQLVKFKLEIQKYPFRKQKKTSKAPESKKELLLKESVFTLNLLPGTANFLLWGDILTIGELITTPLDKLKSMGSLTRLKLKDIELNLAEKGLELSTKVK